MVRVQEQKIKECWVHFFSFCNKLRGYVFLLDKFVNNFCWKSINKVAYIQGGAYELSPPEQQEPGILRQNV